MNADAFLKKIFHSTPPDLFSYLWTRQEGESTKHQTQAFSIQNISTMAASAKLFNRPSTHVSFSMGLLDHFINSHQRAKDVDIVAIPCLWCDIDIENNLAHASQNLVPNLDIAIKCLPPEFPPSIIVNSGYGIHVYWIFEKPLETRDKDSNRKARSMLITLQNRIRKIAYPYQIDQTASLSQMFRLPGTRNWKGNLLEDAPIAKVIVDSDKFYSLDEVDQIIQKFRDDEIAELKSNQPKSSPSNLEEILANRAKSQLIEEFAPITDSSDALFKNCSFMRFCKENFISLNYPDIMNFLPTLLKCPDGFEIAVDLCMKKFGDKFNPQKTQLQLESFARMTPITCNRIHSIYPLNCDFSNCVVPNSNKKSPIALASSPKVQQKIYGGTPLVKSFPDIPDNLRKFIIPEGFIMTSQGILDVRRPKYPIQVIDSPLVISQITENVENNQTELKIAAFIRGEWRYFHVPSELLPAASDLSKILAKYGVNINSKQSKNTSEFLSMFKALNEEQIDVIKAYEQPGWIHNGTDFVLPTLDSTEHREFIGFPAISKHGNRDISLRLLDEISEYPVARLLVDANLAAPLLKHLNARGFVLNISCGSQKGKTTALRFANSLWGAETFGTSFNATANFLEAQFIKHNDLPTNINEWEHTRMRDQDEAISQIVHRFEEGLQRGRSDRTGRARKQMQFRGILCMTAERQPTTQSSLQGVKTRLLELHVPGVFVDENENVNVDLCKRIHDATKTHFGIIGAEYIQMLIDDPKYLQIAKETQKSLYDSIEQMTKVKVLESHVEYLSEIGTAHYLCEIMIRKRDEFDATNHTIDYISKFVPLLQPLESIKDTTRAKGCIEDFVNVNEDYFKAKDPAKIAKRYGFFMDGQIFIYPGILNQCLKDGGFSPEKIVNELSQSKDIDCGNNDRKSKSVKDPGGIYRRVIELVFMNDTQRH